MKYKKYKDTDCYSCNQENIPLFKYEDSAFCWFCFESIGKSYDTVTKKMMSQMLHTLLKQIKNKESE